ncbi:MAG: VWA domain-containing protein [Kiritimatiellaeota bacterium]|nr:VWA domain-containing protein [Kiritimatiellota bacterium]
MNFLFLNPGLLSFAALIAAPALIHLLARMHPPVWRISSVRFIRHAVRRTTRIHRPRSWLLLILRTLLFAAVVLAFLRPVFFPHRTLAAWSARRSVVIVVDASASMTCVEGAQSRFDRACAEAAAVLSSLRAGDHADVVWMGARPQAVFPVPGANIARLRQALRTGRCTLGRADISGAVRMALDLLGEAPGRRQICIVSDFQAGPWQQASVRLPPDVDLLAVPVARTLVPNLAVTRVTISPAAPVAGEPVQCLCEVTNFSPVPRSVKVRFAAPGVRNSQLVKIAPWQSATAAFSRRFPKPGVQTLRCEIDSDKFAPDNTAVALCSVRPYLQVGVLGADRPTGAAWMRVLAALSSVRAVPLAPATVWPDALDACLLAEWRGADAAQVRTLLGRGGCAVIEPAAGPLDALLCPGATAGKRGASVAAVERLQPPLGLHVAVPDAPLFDVFGRGEYGEPGAGAFRRRLGMPPGLLPGGKNLLEYTDGVPALRRAKGRRGMLFLWNMPLAPEASDCAARPELVVLLGEILSQHRVHPLSLPTPFSGEPVTTSFSGVSGGQNVRLEREADGRAVPVVCRPIGGRTHAVSASTPGPGVYTWRIQSRVLGRVAVSFPAEESDLRTAAPGDLNLAPPARALVLSGGAAAVRLRNGTQLWPFLIAAALVVVALESLVVWSGAAKQRENE